jgi:hypothetical protein
MPLPDVYGRPRSREPLLFDLLGDPDEQHNLAVECPDKLAELGSMLDDWRASMVPDQHADPILSHGLSLPYERFMLRLFGQSIRE